ncbi:MAG: 3-deoxy-8-phosphooctulonate synthase [Planctomycetes bacterium]|nr:3-deoxy-8-phosphooctulonate synthase [Planctomycetota bacterium]
MREQRTSFTIGRRTLAAPLWIVGPDVIESEGFALEVAGRLAEFARELRLSLVFKASFEKANRSSATSFRGPGLREGLRILRKVAEATGLPVTSDVHGIEQVAPAAEVLDVIQIPAFLCRQNALLEAAAATGKVVNLKKGQFLSPWDIAQRVQVLRGAGAAEAWITERGVSFGYQRLVNDFRVVPLAHECGAALIFDATHSVQTPGGALGVSGGERSFIPVLARAAAGAGVDGFFLEVHPAPEEALCDGANAVPLARLPAVAAQILPIAEVVRGLPECRLE